MEKTTEKPMETMKYLTDTLKEEDDYAVYIKVPELELPPAGTEEKQPPVRLLLQVVIMECPKCKGYGICHEGGFRCGNKNCEAELMEPELQRCGECGEMADITYEHRSECACCHYKWPSETKSV